MLTFFNVIHIKLVSTLLYVLLSTFHFMKFVTAIFPDSIVHSLAVRSRRSWKIQTYSIITNLSPWSIVCRSLLVCWKYLFSTLILFVTLLVCVKPEIVVHEKIFIFCSFRRVTCYCAFPYIINMPFSVKYLGYWLMIDKAVNFLQRCTVAKWLMSVVHF